MLTMMNQKGGLYTINHLHHPQHSQQPESLHMNAVEYLVVYNTNACISARDIHPLLVQRLVLPKWSQLPFIAICARVGKHSSNN